MTCIRSGSCNDDARAGVLQHVGEIVADGLGVDGNPDRTCTCDRQHQWRAPSRRCAA